MEMTGSQAIIFEGTAIFTNNSGFRIPLTAVTGKVRMRVAMKWSTFPTACETFDRGEVEDYTVDIDGTNANCTLSAAASDVICSDNGTPNTAADDTYTFKLTVNKGSACVSTFWQSGFTVGSFGVPENFGPFPISGGAQNLIVRDGNASQATTTVTVNPPATCSNGGGGNQPDLTLTNLTIPTPSVQQGQVLNFRADFKNIGTAAATGNFTVKSYLSTDNVLSANDYQDGSVPTGSYAAGLTILQVPAAMTVRNTVAAGQYYLILKIDADNQITESNENNNTLVSTGLITVTGTTGGGGSDIALSLTSTPSVYRQYTTQNFRITATNSGTTAFSNVKIKFTRPALTASGGTKVASIGTYQEFCPGGIECSEWTIPTLAGGATATLDAPIFILAPTGGITATAAILSSTPIDNTTANNTASVTVNSATAPIAQPLVVYKPTQLIPVVIQKISPTLTDGEITLELESLIEKTVDFGISNAMGQQVMLQQLPIERGMNKLGFDVSQLPQGLYFIQTNVGKGRNVPTKFIKL